MIDKQTQRFIKEGLLAIYRAHPEAIEYAVYYLPFEHHGFEEIGESIRSMHGIPEIPWPEENCIICTEDYISSLLGSDIKLFIMILHTKEAKNRFPGTEGEIVEPLEFFRVFLEPGEPGKAPIYIDRQQIALIHKEATYSCPITEQYLQNSADEHPLDMTNEQKEKLKSYWRATIAPTFEGIWVARMMSLPNQDQMGLASDILGYLANIVVPCHYFVKSTFKNGFGSKSQKRITRCKPIFSVISYDRLHRTFIQGNEDCHDSVEFHFRRGHIRHHWKRAGISRLSLPDSPIERMKIVHANRVERTYIQPMWIGKNEFEIDGMKHEILRDEIPLAQIGR